MSQTATKKKPRIKNKGARPQSGARALSEKAASPKRKRTLTKRGVALLSVLGLVLISSAVFSIAALTYDKIYPNLSAYGIDFGGMTRGEAETVLSGHLDDVYRGKSVELSLDGETVTVTAEQAGVRLSPAGTADALYNMGRGKGPFSRIGFALSSLFSRREVESADDFYIDRGAVVDIVSSLSGGLRRETVEYVWEIGKTAIEVTSGRDGAYSEPEEMADAVVASFKTLDFKPLTFHSTVRSPAPLPLEELLDTIYIEPADAYIVLDGDSQASVVPHVVGVSFDMGEAIELAGRNTERFSIPLLFSVPEITSGDLTDNLFRDMLGQYSTSTVGSSQNRVTNIDLTARYMTGTVLLPGDQFSFNQVVGNRTEERGFKMAGSYLNGKIVDAIGGGVCQSSTTLYNAVLLSNLHIVERQGHSMTVAYVPLGQDAAVDWGRIDFVFSNDTAYPIRVEAWYANSRLNVQIWGTKTDDLTVSIERDIISHRPAQTITEFNPALTPGERVTKSSGSDGWTVQTYRVLTDPGGNVVYRNPEARTGYMKVDTVVEVGTPPGGDLPEQPDQPVITDPTPDPSPEPGPEPDPVMPSEEPKDPVSIPENTTEEDPDDL